MSRVPFKLDVAEGFVSLRGAVYLDDDTLVVESQKKALDMVPFGTTILRIPADEIEAIHVESGMVRTRLVIRPFSFEYIEDFPGATTDELSLPIARRDRGAAETLVRETRLRNLPR